jgi:hypothetical protein
MQCKAKRRDGNRCNSDAIKGGTVCRMHGGGAPQVRDAAKQRLLEMVNPALAALSQVISQKKDNKARVAASNSVLDRAGFKPTDKLEISGSLETQSELDLSRLSAEQLSNLAGIIAAATSSHNSGTEETERKQDSPILSSEGTTTP